MYVLLGIKYTTSLHYIYFAGLPQVTRKMFPINKLPSYCTHWILFVLRDNYSVWITLNAWSAAYAQTKLQIGLALVTKAARYEIEGK